MSHKNAGPETATQTEVREFWTALLAPRGITIGWGRDKQGRFLAQAARDAEAAWAAAVSSAPAGFTGDENVKLRSAASLQAIAESLAQRGIQATFVGCKKAWRALEDQH